MQMLAAKELGRPVRWISSRSEGFMTDTHGRGNIATAELALDKDGKFLALKIDWIADMGAYLSATGSASHTRNATTCLSGVYAIPALYNHIRLAFTNTTPIAAFRGAGRPDIAYVIERVVNQAAMDLKVDPAELRRKNLIPSNEPYKTANGATYENADLAGCLDKALKAADWAGFEKRRAAAKKKGPAPRNRHSHGDRADRRGPVSEGPGADRVHRRRGSPRSPSRIPRARATRPRSRWSSRMRSSCRWKRC